MDLDRRERELLDDLRVGDGHGLVDLLALDPLSGEGGRGDRGAAPEGLELGVDDRVALDLDLQLHHVATLGGADDAGADLGRVLVQGADVPGVVVMVEDLFAVCHLTRWEVVCVGVFEGGRTA